MDFEHPMQLNLTQLPRTPSHEPVNSKIFMLSFYLGRHFSIEQREKDLDYHKFGCVFSHFPHFGYANPNFFLREHQGKTFSHLEFEGPKV